MIVFSIFAIDVFLFVLVLKQRYFFWSLKMILLNVIICLAVSFSGEHFRLLIRNLFETTIT